jgi:hypothetical protein
MVCSNDQCDARVGGEKRWLKRSRKDGSTYSFPVLMGAVRCQEDAIVMTPLAGGKTRRRCMAHRREM